MDRATIEQRMGFLAQAKREQMHRLEAARAEQQQALTSLERIEGARQDCEFWLGEIASQECAAKVETVERNGVCETAASN